MEDSRDNDVLSLIRRKDGAAMTEDDEQTLLPYASIINIFSEMLTSSEATSTIDMIQRKDRAPMTEEDDAALIPYGGFVMLLNLMLPETESEFDEMSEEDLFSEFECVQRRDGSPMTEDDEAALLPYSGMLSMFSVLSDLPGELDASPTGYYGDGIDEVNVFADIVRKDGSPFTSEDSDMLMEFGGLIHAFKALSAVYELAYDSCDPFEEVKRLDGRDLEAEDEAALMEFYPAFKFVSTAYDKMCSPLAAVFYPDGDEDLTEFGEQLGKILPDSSVEEHIDMKYSAWSLVGNVFVAIYQRAVGSLNSPWEVQTSNSQNTGLKRKPSGAELSAWIGLATQKTFGLDDPQRKVRARGVL